MKNLEDLLIQTGFLESEAKVILALMELGSAKVKDISQKSGVDRVNTYGVLEKLSGQGLVSQNEMSGIKTYISEPPEKFLQLIKDRQQKITNLEKQFLSSLPEFSALYNLTPQKPQVRFYEGVDGIKTILVDTLKTGENYCHISPKEALSEKLYDLSMDYMKEKITSGIKTKAIFERTPWTEKHILKDKSENRQSRFLPKKYKVTTGLRIYGNKIALINYHELMGTVIEDAQISQMVQMMFDVLWETSEKAN